MQELTIKQKLTSYYCYYITNSILAIIIALFYLPSLPIILPKNTLFLTFFTVNHISHILFIGLIFSLFALPSIVFNNKTRKILQSIFVVLLFILLCMDIKIFKDDSIHLNVHAFINCFIKSFLYMGIKQWILAISLIIVAIVSEYFLLSFIDKHSRKINIKTTRDIALIYALLLVISHVSYNYFSTQKKYNVVTLTRYLPWFYANNSSGFLTQLNTKKYNLTDPVAVYTNSATKLNYPLKQLQTSYVNKPPNILIIGLDAWRADCFNEVDSPNLWNLSQKGIIFNNHYSGGNATYMSLLGLFYSLPSSYWYNILQEKISPEFIDRLNGLEYQMNVFLSGALINNSEHAKTFFNKINNLYLKYRGEAPSICDINSTNGWLSWYASLDKNQPFFSFIFYDSLHGPDFPEGYNNQTPAGRLRSYKKFAENIGKKDFIKSYKTSVHFIDSLATKVLNALKQANQLDNTLVIITGDHGCEFNDHNQQFWGYGSNFTDCQIKVPFAIIGPKFNNAKQVDSLSSHFDVVPTIMKNFLGVKNDLTDYAIGRDLLANDSNPSWVLSMGRSPAAIKFGIIEPNKITTILDLKLAQQLTKNNLPLDSTINYDFIHQLIEMATRFLAKQL